MIIKFNDWTTWDTVERHYKARCGIYFKEVVEFLPADLVRIAIRAPKGQNWLRKYPNICLMEYRGKLYVEFREARRLFVEFLEKKATRNKPRSPKQ